ncbi:MAG: hypothetical protein ACK5N8_02995 [Alphaproteobacteria bacterium]
MRKTGIYLIVEFVLFFVSFDALADVGMISDMDTSNGGVVSSSPTQKPCPLRGYRRTSCPVGQVAQNFCPENEQYFSSCGCDLNYYQFSEQNCNLDKQELSGSTCVSENNIKLYKSCSCKSSFKFCKEGAFKTSTSCEDSSGVKYAICNEDIPSCESIGHLSSVPVGYKCNEISNEYMKCYVSSTCTKI